MRVLVLVLLLAGSCFGQIETDCREVYAGNIRCYSTDNRIQRPMGNNRIQIPDYAADNLRRDRLQQERIEGLRRAIETRARIDQMRSQVLLNNAITNQLNDKKLEAPVVSHHPIDFFAETPKAIDFLEVLDYAKKAMLRYKAGDLSAEMMKSLVNLKAHEWEASLQNRGLRPIQIDQLIAQGKADLRALQLNP